MTDTATPKRPADVRRARRAEVAPGDRAGQDAARRAAAEGRAADDARPAHRPRRASASRRPSTDDNPLREGLRLERVPDPSILVLFGATGDLAHRKVIPALYQLWRTNLLPHEFVVLAIGRRDYDDETLRAELRDVAREVLARAAARRGGLAVASRRGSATSAATSTTRPTTTRSSRRSRRSTRSRARSGNHLYYLATQPSAFAEIVAQLGRVGLDHERHEGGWRRIVIEKPFGHDLNSAIRLNREVGKVFRESQVYRIDHYLGKETVRNLLVFRFGNGIFEPIWNRRHIDHVQITVAESIGVENRGAFYEETGASRDFLQNHLLQLMSLVAMEPPATFDADALRDEKVKVIRAIGELTRDADPDRRRPRPVRPRLGRGQAGPGLPRRSRRSTRSRRPRRSSPPGSRSTTGAGRASRSTSGPASACRSARPRSRSSSRRSPTGCSGSRRTEPDPNLLAIRIQPDEGIMLRFGAKVPGPRHRRPVGDDGLHLRLGVHGRLARRLRDADPRRPPRRRVAVHPGRRGRGRLGARDADHRRVGRRAARRTSRTTRPARGAPTQPTSCSPAKAGSGGGSEPAGAVAPTDRHRPAPNEPVLRWRSRAHSIEEVEQELARIWAADEPARSTSNGDGVDDERHVARPDERDEPRRHRPPAGGRRALRGDHPAARPAATRRGRRSSSRPTPTARPGSTPRSWPTASCPAPTPRRPAPRRST